MRTIRDDVSTKELAIRLGDESEDVRLKAREEILRRGQEAAPKLVRAIEAELVPEEAHSFACGTLAEIKPQFAGETPDALMQALEESVNWDSCAAVSRALVNFGPAATAPLLALLTCGDKEIYAPTAHALAEIAKADPSIMPAVVKALEAENWKVRSGAVEVLFAIEPPRPVEAIAPLIRSLNEEKNYRIISVLELFGAQAIPALLESLRSTDWRIRVGSAKTLEMIELCRKLNADREPYFESGVVPALVEALGDEKVEVVRAAAAALATLESPETDRAIPTLLAVLRERHAGRFRAVAPSMNWIRSEPALEIGLTGALADKDAGIRASAADLLGCIGVAATSAAVPALLGALNDDTEEVRFRAACALAVIDPLISHAGVPILHSVLAHGGGWAYMKDSSRPWERREDAIRGLARHGAAAAEAVPALIDALDEYLLADRAADALGSIGSLASAAVPALLRALQSSEEDLRDSAARALSAIGPESASAAVAILLDLLSEPHEYNRCAAADCLGTIGLPAAEVAIPALQELMHDESECTRQRVAWALEELGCRQPPATD